MGTVVSFSVVPGSQPRQSAARAIGSACAALHRADRVFSTWDPQSPVSRLRRGAATLGELPAEVAQVLDLCEEARRASGGWFDPWSIPGGVDPTGLVKGWAVEQALDILRAAGMAAAMVNGGGDIAVFGAPSQARAGESASGIPGAPTPSPPLSRSPRRSPPPAAMSGACTWSTRSPGSRPARPRRPPSPVPAWPSPTRSRPRWRSAATRSSPCWPDSTAMRAT